VFDRSHDRALVARCAVSDGAMRREPDSLRPSAPLARERDRLPWPKSRSDAVFPYPFVLSKAAAAGKLQALLHCAMLPVQHV
jgi:hypothetical protein